MTPPQQKKFKSTPDLTFGPPLSLPPLHAILHPHYIDSHYHNGWLSPHISMWKVRELLAAGANIQEHHGPMNYTPLHLAIQSSQLDVVQLLLEQGADIHAVTVTGSSCMHIMVKYYKCLKCEDEIFALLHTHGAQLDAKDRNGQTPTHLAATSGWSSLHLLKKFIDFGADLSVADNDGNTILHVAVGRGIQDKNNPEYYFSTRDENHRVVRLVLGHVQGGSYATLRATNRFGKSPEYWTNDFSLTDMIKAAIEPARRIALTAVAMGQHQRLGDGSPIGLLEPELFRMVASYM
jgi:Ankyrin repeat/Ankyrin repeats (3 copies)